MLPFRLSIHLYKEASLRAHPISTVGPSPSDDDVEGVVAAIVTANHHLLMASSRALEGLHSAISPLQLRALTVLASGSQRLIDLADAVEIAPSTATRLCDTLMKDALIVKDRDDTDRREIRLSLAPLGRRLLSDLEKRRRREFERIVKSISSQQRRQLIRTLRNSL